ncbi:hypothetical protein EK21DRAFT_25411, partial [Setomelanomma holmii]
EDFWNDYPRQMRQRVRKAAGRPALTDVVVLASMINEVVRQLERPIELPVLALISFPALSGLYQEDITDATFYAGLCQLRNGYEFHPHEVVAAYAGDIFGLERRYDNSSTCSTGEKKFPIRHLLLVECTKVALLLHHDVMSEAFE